VHIRPDQLPQAYLREAPLWRVDKEFPWKPIGPEGLDVPLPASDVDRAAERAGWGRRAVADLVDAIAEDRQPETGMYAGRTVLEMTSAIYRSAVDGGRVSWPMKSAGSPLS
jgi:hypothetical protein